MESWLIRVSGRLAKPSIAVNIQTKDLPDIWQDGEGVDVPPTGIVKSEGQLTYSSMTRDGRHGAD